MSDTYIDEIAVERRAAGDRTVHLYRHERIELVRRLNTRGHNDHEIARRTGYVADTVLRIRQRNNIPAVERNVA